MTWTDPKTMGHEPALYSDWNTYVRDNTNHLHSMFMIKAWVSFNGTGTVAILGSYNVSSITDNGVGDYTVNFTTAMPNTNYAAITSATLAHSDLGTKTVSSIQIKLWTFSSYTAKDTTPVDVVIVE